MSRLGPPSFSTAKSFVLALIGAAIADGSMTSVDDPVIKFITQIAGRGLDSMTIRNLLLMNSGIRYEYNSQLPFYRHPFGDDSLTYFSPDMRKTALRVEADGTLQDQIFHYNNYHLLLEGMILERATGVLVSEYMQEKFWKPMGAEYHASWSLDSNASGFEKMESGINARAMDCARSGFISSTTDSGTESKSSLQNGWKSQLRRSNGIWVRISLMMENGTTNTIGQD